MHTKFQPASFKETIYLYHIIPFETIIMRLPNELILDILQHQSKADLKSARLVSKAWSACASKYLFTKLFISAHQLDLQVFTAIAQDSVLSQYVQELQYDSVDFTPEITITEYFKILWYQTYNAAYFRDCDFKDMDPEISVFVSLSKDFLKGEPEILAKAQKQCIDFAFVQEGYRRWMDQAAFAKRCSEQNTLLKLLIAGLTKFSQLQIVELRDTVPCRRKPGYRGSPLTRSWRLFDAHPGCRRSDSDPIRKQAIISNNFWTLTYALSEAGKTGIRSLSIGNPLYPSAFLTNLKQPTHVDCGFAAYHGLEYLQLSFAEVSSRAGVELLDNLHDLQRLLECTAALKHLRLHSARDYIKGPVEFLRYEMVFPKDGYWPQLTTLTMGGLAIGTSDLITLLITKMPSLRCLVFGNIILLDGQWEGIFEYLRVANHLSCLNVTPNGQLLHRQNQVYLSPEFSNFVRNPPIGNYIVNWWHNPTLKHPDLSQDQPAQCSLDYLPDVFRLCEMHDMEDRLEELAEHMVAEAERYRRRQDSLE